MATRTIDGPTGEWLTTVKAARWLGVHEDTLVRLADDYEWIRPRKIRGALRWHWMDLVCLSRIIHCMPDKITDEAPKRTAKKKSDGKSPTAGDR